MKKMLAGMTALFSCMWGILRQSSDGNSSRAITCFKSIFRFIIALFVLFALHLPFVASSNAADLQTIPIDDAHWNVIHRGPWSLIGNGLQVNGSGMRVNNTVLSEDKFDFAGSEVLVKWQANGAGTYMGYPITGGILIFADFH